MSEYQYIAFRAIDAPVAGRDLDYMRNQSSRAEVTPWSFENEYHYSDFGGNVKTMLRRGYDVHLHYANFGIRTLMLRLPSGLPGGKAALQYLDDEALCWHKDKSGSRGILEISPFYEPGDLDELWDLGAWLDRLVGLRGELIAGDLRPLFLAAMAVSADGNHDPDETPVPPIPAGLGKLTRAQSALAEFYEINDSLLSAASKSSPALPKQQDVSKQHQQWLDCQSQRVKDAWLLKVMSDEPLSVRAELLAEFRAAQPSASWPTSSSEQTMANMEVAAAGIQQQADEQAAVKAARELKQLRLDMASDPQPYLRKTDKLVSEQSVTSYEEASRLLAELREALRETPMASLAEQHAKKLKQKHPKRHHLTAAMRREGFLPK